MHVISQRIQTPDKHTKSESNRNAERKQLSEVMPSHRDNATLCRSSLLCYQATTHERARLNIFAIRKSMYACYKRWLTVRSTPFVVAILLFCNIGMVQPQSFTTAISCQTDSDCKTEVGLYSSCRPGGICSTNPYEQGCLFRHGLVEKMRICNSEDDPNAAAQGLCRLADIKYPEVRLYSPNWESAIMETWILQIILSELLDVPTSTETGLHDAKTNFYNHWQALDLGIQDVVTALETASIIGGDCELAHRDEKNYEPCAHVMTEIWDGREQWRNLDLFELPPKV